MEGKIVADVEGLLPAARNPPFDQNIGSKLNHLAGLAENSLPRAGRRFRCASRGEGATTVPGGKPAK